jgi:hypothetical protein
MYPPGAFPGSARRPSRGWIIVAGVAVLAVVAGGLAWWSQRPVPSATGTRQADGSTVVNSRGIHITAPAGWTVVATTPSALAKAGKSLDGSNPQLAAAVREMQSRQQRNILRFFAYETATTGGFTSNANVLVAKLTAPLGEVVAANSNELSSSGATGIHESAVPTSQGAGEALTYQLPLALPQGGSVTLNVDQVYEAKGSSLGILTMETAGASDSTFPALINSFSLD